MNEQKPELGQCKMVCNQSQVMPLMQWYVETKGMSVRAAANEVELESKGAVTAGRAKQVWHRRKGGTNVPAASNENKDLRRNEPETEPEMLECGPDCEVLQRGDCQKQDTFGFDSKPIHKPDSATLPDELNLTLSDIDVALAIVKMGCEAAVEKYADQNAIKEQFEMVRDKLLETLKG